MEPIIFMYNVLMELCEVSFLKIVKNEQLLLKMKYF